MGTDGLDDARVNVLGLEFFDDLAGVFFRLISKELVIRIME